MYAGCLLPKGEGVRKLSDVNSARMHILHMDVTNDSHVTDAVQYVRKHSKDTGLLLPHMHQILSVRTETKSNKMKKNVYFANRVDPDEVLCSLVSEITI